MISSDDDEETNSIAIAAPLCKAGSLVNAIIRKLKRSDGTREEELSLARAKFSILGSQRRSSKEFLDKLQALADERVDAGGCSAYILRFLDALSDIEDPESPQMDKSPADDSSSAASSDRGARDQCPAPAAAHPSARFGHTRKLKHTVRVEQPKRVELLERKLRKLDREIQKLDESEVGLDDMLDEHGAYILQDKLKRQFVSTWEKICQLTGESPNTAREPRIRFDGTPHRKLNKALIKFARRSVDFPSVDEFRRVLIRACERYSVPMQPKEILHYAHVAKNDIGKQLQRHRRKHYWEDHGSRLTDEVVFSGDSGPGVIDPAESNDELKAQLRHNYQLGQERLDQVFKTFSELSEGQSDIADRSHSPESLDFIFEAEECAQWSPESMSLTFETEYVPRSSQAEEGFVCHSHGDLAASAVEQETIMPIEVKSSDDEDDIGAHGEERTVEVAVHFNGDQLLHVSPHQEKF